MPEDPSLPLFSYGIFKPGELGYISLHPNVLEHKRCRAPGRLTVRDGLPLFDSGGHEKVSGCLLVFRPDKSEETYLQIAKFEPGHFYYWKTLVVDGAKCNVLFGRSPDGAGSTPIESDANGVHTWTGASDPLFKDALDVVDETAKSTSDFEWGNLKNLFRLEMAFLLLCSSVERFAALRFCIGENPSKNMAALGKDQIYINRFKESNLEQEIVVHRAGNPKRKTLISKDHPEDSLEGFYQMRCNIVHRGKGNPHDFNRLKSALFALSWIFRRVVEDSFGLSRSYLED